ncbi:hypothetical protein PpBr36_02069 [Pyricularia pennisetigena]|uniref:hypothetical protein n=1 Tax=Pyricularia pennisetigena TaxID=1578925 RepID=UPI00114D5B2A|nr:hypothetical protein PpBr36_02069 [Pyricularia pennisetigena]TLS27899.1 hypothetical protein PpBr36_02069 [Pyricularia pennisetigena]
MGHSLVELNKSALLEDKIGHGLPTSNPNTSLYGVSWTHQLHCLGMIRDGFWDVFSGRNQLVDPSANKSDPRAHFLTHLKHCLDYLQQAVLCSGDVSLEPLAEDDSGRLKINGYGALHRCRDMWLKPPPHAPGCCQCMDEQTRRQFEAIGYWV